MNKVVLMGRLARDPEVRYSQGEQPIAVARYVLAVERKYHREGEVTADFIPCVAFAKNGEFAEKYFHQGMKITISGRIQTGSYTSKEGAKVYTTNVVIEEQSFAESKNASTENNATNSQKAAKKPAASSRTKKKNNATSFNGYGNPGFMDIPNVMEDDLPFN